MHSKIRRMFDAISAQEVDGEPDSRKWVRIGISTLPLAFVVGLLIAALEFFGVTGIWLGYTLLALAWIVLVGGIWFAEWMWRFKRRREIAAIVAVVGAVAFIVIGWYGSSYVRNHQVAGTSAAPVSAPNRPLSNQTFNAPVTVVRAPEEEERPSCPPGTVICDDGADNSYDHIINCGAPYTVINHGHRNSVHDAQAYTEQDCPF